MAAISPARGKTYDIVYIGVFAVLIAISSWISIPTMIPFTLQTFGVFLSVGILGGKRGSLAVLVYLLMGMIGIPVFPGFTGGIGIMLGQTGGYLIGFIFSAMLMWGIEKLSGRKMWVLALSMVLGLIICYAFGTVWFMAVYVKNTGAAGWMTVMGWCVFPFIIPDAVKITLALLLTKRLASITHTK